MTVFALIIKFLISSSFANTAPFDCLDLSAHPSGTQIYQDLRHFQKKLTSEKPELAAPSTAVGYCEKLPQTHVFAYLTTDSLALPLRCAGFTFSVESRRFAKDKAMLITQVEFEALKGQEAVVELEVNGQKLKLPVCIDILDELIGTPETPQESPVLQKTE